MVTAGQRILASDFSPVDYDPDDSQTWEWSGDAVYQMSGNICHVFFNLTFVSGVAGALFLDAPFVPDERVRLTTGHGTLTGLDLSANDRFAGQVKLESSAALTIWSTDDDGTYGAWSNTAPFTWAAGDKIEGSFSFPVD